jgi:hypothetical protein
MTTQDTSALTERLRDAIETTAGARAALERAEAGLRAGEAVSEKVDEARGHPVLLALGLLGLAGLITFVVMLLRSND